MTVSLTGMASGAGIAARDVHHPRSFPLRLTELLPEETSKVARMEIVHVHNCCGACTKAIKKALAEVEGVKADTCKSKEEKFVIEGDFEPKDAIAALIEAGFYTGLPKPKS